MALYDYSSPDTPTAGDPVADEEVLSDEHLSGSQPSDRNPAENSFQKKAVKTFLGLAQPRSK